LLGATVIGTVGTPEKAERARRLGCDHPILYEREDLVARVREITAGRGLPVVYDSVGRATFERSLECLAPFGLLVSFGQSSGAVPPLSLGTLADRGSLYVTRPTLATHVARREDMLVQARELFDVVRRGAVQVDIGATYPLRDAARAHRDLEQRKTTGSIVLLP
jgi:NADPH2:quinone reductase